MMKALLGLELVCVLAAAVAGLLWMRDPSGPFEPYAFMFTLLGVTGTDLLRRHLAAQHERDALVAVLVPELCAALERRLAAIVEARAQRLTPEERAADERMLELARETILAWAESRRGATATPSEAATEAPTVPPHAYGVDGSREAGGDTTLTQIRLRRKGLE